MLENDKWKSVSEFTTLNETAMVFWLEYNLSILPAQTQFRVVDLLKEREPYIAKVPNDFKPSYED